MTIDPRECVCYGCDELDNANGPDCACEQAAPSFDKETCDMCEYSNKCDVPTHPELYSEELPKHIKLKVDEMEARVMNQEFDIHKGFIGQRKKDQKEPK